MPPHNGSNGGSSDFDDTHEEVLLESEEAGRLADAALGAPDDLSLIAKAERALQKAFETDSESRRMKSVRRALEIDPGCTDALCMIAATFDEPADASFILAAAVKVAERRLGPEPFAQNEGRFWDIHETRPYMRAMLALAEVEFELMEYNESFRRFQRLLALAEADNLGVRFTLLGMLLAADRVDDARKLAFERFAYDSLPLMLWARTLILFLERDFAAATALLEQAQTANPYVAALLAGDEEMPDEDPGLHLPGSPEEAAIIVSDLAAAWRIRPLALIWLKSGGGVPGDDRYFGAYTDIELDQLLDEFDDDDFEGEGPYLLN